MMEMTMLVWVECVSKTSPWDRQIDVNAAAAALQVCGAAEGWTRKDPLFRNGAGDEGIVLITQYGLLVCSCPCA